MVLVQWRVRMATRITLLKLSVDSPQMREWVHSRRAAEPQHMTRRVHPELVCTQALTCSGRPFIGNDRAEGDFVGEPPNDRSRNSRHDSGLSVLLALQSRC